MVSWCGDGLRCGVDRFDVAYDNAKMGMMGLALR